MTKFKVGDKVRIVKYPDPSVIGSEGVVAEIHERGDYPIRVPFAWTDSHFRGSLMAEDEIELVESSAQPKFKVGDRVRTVNHGNGVNDYDKDGIEFTITEVSPRWTWPSRAGDYYHYRGDPRGVGVWESRLELVGPAEEYELLDRAYDTLKAAYFELEHDRDYYQFWHDKLEGDMRAIRRAFDLINGGQR